MNTTSLLLGVLFGSIGLGYFLYGKKQGKPVPFLCGIALMGFTYVVQGTATTVAVGTVLMAIPYFVRL